MGTRLGSLSATIGVHAYNQVHVGKFSHYLDDSYETIQLSWEVWIFIALKCGHFIVGRDEKGPDALVWLNAQAGTQVNMLYLW